MGERWKQMLTSLYLYLLFYFIFVTNVNSIDTNKKLFDFFSVNTKFM